MIDGKDSVMPIVTWAATRDWDDVRSLCGGWLTANGATRLELALENRVKVVAVERHYIDRDYRDTFSNYHSKRFSTPPSRCIRLHFFSSPLTRDDMRHSDRVQQHYLGYSVVRPTRPNCIGRTLIKSGLPHLVGAHVCECAERVYLQGALLEIKGFPFISQDTDVTVCAQSALWMTLRYYSNRYSIYPEIHPFEIGCLTRDYSIGRLFPTGGLTSWQLSEAFRQARFSPLIYKRGQFAHDFDNLLYTYLESGIPLLVAFQGHVIAGIGHKTDFGVALPPGAEPVLSSHFNQAIVVHDDNQFPSEILPKTKTGVKGESKYQYSDIESFVVPLPDKVFLPAECFQKLATQVLMQGQYAASVASPVLAGRRLLLRFFLTTVRSFKRRLLVRGMGNNEAEMLYRNLPLPHFIWVCEISDVDLYRSEKKVWGELIWDATCNEYEPDGWIALHYPEMLLVDTGSAFNGSQKIERFDLQGSSAYGLYVSNLEEIK